MTVLPLVMPQTTADQMLGMLRRHYLPEGRRPDGMFAPEIQAPQVGGWNGRRADLIWQPVTSRNHTIIGHEIKVTRQDLRHELEQPEKWRAWGDYCDAWWLVIPHLDLMAGLEIPAEWGVMLPPSGRRTRSMTIARKAARLKPKPQGPAFRTLANWAFWRCNDAEANARASERWALQLHAELTERNKEATGDHD